MAFVGHYEHLIDEKNRLSIPAGFRSEVDPERDGKRMFITPGRKPRLLRLVTEAQFKEDSKRFSAGPFASPREAAFSAAFFSLSQGVDVDNNGRIVIPAWQLQQA